MADNSGKVDSPNRGSPHQPIATSQVSGAPGQGFFGKYYPSRRHEGEGGDFAKNPQGLTLTLRRGTTYISDRLGRAGFLDKRC